MSTENMDTASNAICSTETDSTGNNGRLPPEADPPDAEEPAFFTVSESKLLNMYILSFGLYGIYWFYKNWKLQQRFMDKKIYPLIRGFFSIFFVHSLFSRIKNRAAGLETEENFNPGLLASLYVATFVLDVLLDGINANTTLLYGVSNSLLTAFSLAMFFISAYPLLKAQALINRINGDILGFQNNRYSLSNYALMAFGVLLWLMFALGFLAESLGFVGGG